jgi:cytochrome P450
MDLLNTLGVSTHISSKWSSTLASTLASTSPLTVLAITLALLASYPILKLFYALFISHTIYTHFHPLRRLPRIKSRPSLLLGANQVILDSPPGQAERKWLDDHDTTVIVYPGFLGTHSVYVADPTAIHHLFGPGHGAYEKSEIRQRILRVLLGQGLVTATSKQAVKQRRIIVPALQTKNLERLAPVFQDACEGMVDVVRENLIAAQKETGKQEMTVLDLGDVLWACSLDIIGKAGFGYDFHAVQSARRRVPTTGTTTTNTSCHNNTSTNSVLDEKNLSTANTTNTTTMIPPQNRLARAFDDAMEATLKPSTFDRLVTLVAAVLFPVFTMLPITKANRECVKARKLMDHVAGGILDQRLNAVEEAGLKEKADFEGDQKDLLGVLVRANRATDLKPDQRLTRPELLGQLTTFLVAGHETTAAAAAWLLYYLSLYPDIQARVYEEVKELDKKLASEGREGGRPTWREMAELPLLRACFFEASRLQPSLPVTHRDAVEDDVIPLSRREFSSDGNIFVSTFCGTVG